MLRLKNNYFRIVLFTALVVSLASLELRAQLILQKLSTDINTDMYEEIGPVLSEDGRTLYFTRVASPDFIQKYTDGNTSSFTVKLRNIFSKIAGKDVQDISTSAFNQDIWVAQLDSENVPLQVIHPPYPLNNAYPNSVCSIFPEEESIVIINQFGKNGEIYEGFSKVKVLENYTFGEPQPLDIYDYHDEGANVNLTMSRDGQHIFISMRRKDTKGQNDLYVSVNKGNGTWTTPKPLNGNINTPFNETSPFLSKDKKILFFSSNKPGGAGKQDLYMSKRLDYSYANWSEPVALGEPVNGPYDDFLLSLSDDERYLFFNSNRDGSSDIFFVDMNRRYILPEPIVVHLNIIDGITKKPIRSTINWSFGIRNVEEGFFTTYNGKYNFEIVKNVPHLFEISKRGYQTEKVHFEPNKVFLSGIVEESITIELYPKNVEKPEVLEPKIVEPKMEDIVESADTSILKKSYALFGNKRKIVLDQIQFQKGKTHVLSKSMKAIEELVHVLQSNPNLNVLILGHTDNVGDEKALIELSLKRAEAIKKHLVAYSVDHNRIFTIGKGASEPLNDNSTEELKKANRRVEVQILNDK